MDVFSAGVVIWEVASGRRLVPESLTKDQALTMLSAQHGGGQKVPSSGLRRQPLAWLSLPPSPSPSPSRSPSPEPTQELEKTIADAIAPLDAALRASLASMLEIEPLRRKDAGAVLQSSLVSGNITTMVRPSLSRNPNNPNPNPNPNPNRYPNPNA